jgi:asparagine synthase (glutamine-hydrolysing)
MCGICGAIGFENGESLTRRMNARLIHRGPDSDGFFNSAPFHLGMRRLKIIDFATGDQPIFNENKTIAIVLNGEIYNFRQLYNELIEYGHRFSTKSDTEVIVHAYEQWGADCPKRLRGMFAFAIFDSRNQSLFLARDRFGIKPLYLWHNDRQMLFASEVRALLDTGVMPRVISNAGLFSYLAFGSVQEPLSLIDSIVSLPSASCLRVKLRDGALNMKQSIYWEPPNARNQIVDFENVHDVLKNSISSHLISDAPLGIFLSGGLDSGAIACLASESALENGHQAITFDFHGSDASELCLTQATAKQAGLSLSVATLNEDGLLDDLSQIFRDMDQPSLDGVNSWYISREARRAGWKVALSGVGGDELFAGYPTFSQARMMKWLPTSLPFTEMLSASNMCASSDTRRKLLSYLGGSPPLGHPYYAIRGLFTFAQTHGLLNDADAINSPAYSMWMDSIQRHVQLAQRYDDVGQMSWLETSQYMTSTLLRDLDAMSMAHSLEVRVPFVDHLVYESILPVAARYKMERNKRKPLMVNALHGLLPREILGAKKHTFTFPFDTWLRQKLSARAQKSLENCMGMPEHFNEHKVREVWENFERGRTNWSRPWTLFVLGEWVSAHL